jgi:hypothetical protein
MVKLKLIPSRPFYQSDDWKLRAPVPLAHSIEREHLADMAIVQRQSESSFGKRVKNEK